MTKFKDLLQIHKNIKSDLNGNVCIGTNQDKDLIVLSLNNDGNLILEEAYASSLFFGTDTCLPGEKKSLFSQNILPNEKIIVSSIIFTGNGLGLLTCKIDGYTIMNIRNSYMEQTKTMNHTFEVLQNQNISFEVTNTTFTNQINDYECFVFYRRVVL